jgi:hypothetical protein
MEVIQYHLYFANGEGAFLNSVEEADDLVAQRTGVFNPRAPDDLLPAHLWLLDSPNAVGTGKLVKTYPRQLARPKFFLSALDKWCRGGVFSRQAARDPRCVGSGGLRSPTAWRQR